MDSIPSRSTWIFCLILLTGILRCLEESVENANEARMQKLSGEKNQQAKKLMFLIENHAQFYSSIRVFMILAELFISTLGVSTLSAWLFADMDISLSLLLSVVILVVLMFIFCIHMPRRIAEMYPDAIALKFATILTFIYYIGLPVSFTLTAVSNVFLLIFGIKPSDTEEEVTEEEIRLMVDIGSESGAIDPEEKEMIHNIFELDDTQVGDIMTHRTDTEFLWIEETEDWDKIISETNHSVYPVCNESIDNIIGILSSSDYYKARLNGSDTKKILKTPFFVPETVKADDLFRKMQKAKNHFAVVLDEYGGISGIITMNDLLEEIVGNLSEENDSDEENDIVKIDDNTWRISGSCDIELVSQTLDIPLPIEEYNTFGGLIFAQLGEIPKDGSTPSLEAFGMSIKVSKIKEHRIESTKVALLEPIQNNE
ncbi:MAG: HlyC/CorC family transporter [Ruminococcaceae bacterium]|nr:HlyC/CorC family transporter [Oscillospiraceae bacterium]